MEPHYSAFADLLNKFHTAAPAIQALWLLALPGTALGVAWLVMRGLRDLAVIRRTDPETRSLLVYGVVQDPDGQWHVIRHGQEPKPLDWTNPPRELLGRAAWTSGSGPKGRDNPGQP